MLRALDLQLALAAASMKRLFAYRVANWAGLFTNAWFLLFRAFALAAFYAGRAEPVAGYAVGEAVAYVVVTQALIMVIPQWGRFGLGDAVRSGQIGIDLLRPAGLFEIHMGQRMGESAYYLLMRAVPLGALAWLAGLWVPPADPVRLAACAASVVLGAWVVHVLFLLFESTSFWLESDLGPRYVLMSFQALLGGLLLPIAFFPAPVLALARATPFPSTLHAPVAILLGKEDPAFLVVQAAWAVGLSLAARGVLALGARKVVVHGG